MRKTLEEERGGRKGGLGQRHLCVVQELADPPETQYVLRGVIARRDVLTGGASRHTLTECARRYVLQGGVMDKKPLLPGCARIPVPVVA